MRKIFNPLDHLKQQRELLNSSEVIASDTEMHLVGDNIQPESMVSQSAFYNDVVGVCPKCQGVMATSKIANSDTVYFCPRDRVVLPLPDSINNHV